MKHSNEEATQKLAPFLWFDGTAGDAAEFYTGIFEGGKVTSLTRYGNAGQEIHGRPEGQVMVAAFELMGYQFAAINGGPQFSVSPAISFFVQVKERAEAERLWAALSDGGQALMPFEAYEWSPLYGWLSDRFGVSWQISWDREGEAPQPITPLLSFTQARCGMAKEALEFYASVFPESAIEVMAPYPEDAPGSPGGIMHGRANLSGTRMMAMDAADNHDFGFDEAISFTILCADQAEVDYYWDRLVEDGGEHSMCGWLRDRFGVSWQITPEAIPRIMSDPDRAAANRAMEAVMQMRKIDIAAVEAAATEKV